MASPDLDQATAPLKIRVALLALFSFTVSGLRAADELPGLKDVFAEKFLIGTAIHADVALAAHRTASPTPQT